MTGARKGQGSVSKLPSGKFLVKVPVGQYANGKTRYRSVTCQTKTEAVRQHSSLIRERESMTLISGPRQTLRRFSSEVLLNPSDQISDRTRDGYFRVLQTHVFSALGSKVLSAIKPQEVERLLKELRKSRSASTVNQVRTALSHVFTIARRLDLVIQNPVERTQKARRGEYEKTQVCLPLNQEEIRLLLAAANGTPIDVVVNLLLATGMRRGELLGLRWSDIDFEHQTVFIERSIHREATTQLDGSRVSKVVVAPPKTAASRRPNQLTEPILDVLIRHQMEQEISRQAAGNAWREEGYVLTNSVGGPLDESKLSKSFARFLKKNGLRHIRIHDLRHTFATVLIEEDGGKLASVSRALGHSSIAITMDTYARTARIETQAASRMTEIMYPDRGKQIPLEIPAPAWSAHVGRGGRRVN